MIMLMKSAYSVPFYFAVAVFIPHRFVLLVPKDKDHYNPIMCLEQSLYTIVDCMSCFLASLTLR
jgi:hypothetical protein